MIDRPKDELEADAGPDENRTRDHGNGACEGCDDFRPESVPVSVRYCDQCRAEHEASA